MATITQRKDQDNIVIGYQAQVRKKGHPTQTRTFRTRRDAEAWARGIESEMERGIWRDRSEAESTTLAGCIDRYLREVTPGKRHNRQEVSRLGIWAKRPVAKRFMSAIRGRDVAEVIQDMEAEGKAPNTIRLHLAVLSHLFKVARTEWGMESLTNPVELVRKPRLPQGRNRRLVGDEETRLLAACDAMNPELGDIVRFAIETAMRQGEIMSMTWSMLNLPGHHVHLDKTKNDVTRDVPLSSTAERILAGLPRRLDGQIWTYTQEGMRTSYNKALVHAGIEGLTFHDLRHEATSRLFEKGFNPMEVSAITGHKTLQMLKRYTHLRAEDLAKRMG